MKYASIDIETTGRNPEHHQVIEFGAVLDDLTNQKPLEELPTFHAYVMHDQYIGEAYALSMHPQILRRIAEREKPFRYMGPSKLGHEFKKFLMEHGHVPEKDAINLTVAGKNFGTFDKQFLDRLPNFNKHIMFRHRILDPSILYMDITKDDAPPCSQICYDRAELKREVAHTAIDDAMAVIELLRRKIK